LGGGRNWAMGEQAKKQWVRRGVYSKKRVIRLKGCEARGAGLAIKGKSGNKFQRRKRVPLSNLEKPKRQTSV